MKIFSPKQIPKNIASGFVKLYQLAISPLFGPCCRYHPTCSHYARKALSRHGLIKGALLAILRLLRCHPASKHPANDPVPEEFAWKDFIGYKRKTADKKS